MIFDLMPHFTFTGVDFIPEMISSANEIKNSNSKYASMTFLTGNVLSLDDCIGLDDQYHIISSSNGKNSVNPPLSLKTFNVSLFCLFAEGSINSIITRFSSTSRGVNLSKLKEEKWEYELPEMDKAVKTITVGLDGTCMLMIDEGYRGAMAGTIGFYDRDGERMHTIYIGAGPEHGKQRLNGLKKAILMRIT